MVLIEEDGRAAQLQPHLLDALLIVNRDQEGLAAFLGFHGCQDGEVLRKIRLWNRGQGEKETGEPQPSPTVASSKQASLESRQTQPQVVPLCSSLA